MKIIVPIALTEQVKKPEFRSRYPLAQLVWEYLEERRKRVEKVDNSYVRSLNMGGVATCRGTRLWEVRTEGLHRVPFMKRVSEPTKRRKGNPVSLF